MTDPRDVAVVSVAEDSPISRDQARLPAAVPSTGLVPHRPLPAKRLWARLALLLVVAVGAAGGGAYWWTHRPPPIPPGIAYGNGRLEADPIDIATKFAGRVYELRVDEGDRVSAGQIVALMDVRDLEASLRKAEAQVQQAHKAIAETEANVELLHSQVVLATEQMERARTLLKNGWATRELADQRQQQLDSARAAEVAAMARVNAAKMALRGVEHDVELLRVHIADNTLVAPRDGRIEYRIANVGEVLPAGGKVFTMLDVSYVYMDIYLPTLIAGQVKVGDEARIVLDAWPDRALPAKVTFIAAQAQFTPKMVETRTEREKLMFRVRARIDPEAARAFADRARSGVPGVAYVRFDPRTEWPERLRGGPPGQR
jgi:HlyD family secretion protein